MTCTVGDVLERYFRHVPGYLNPRTNRNIHALLAAWAGADCDSTNNLEEAKKQLFVKHATGVYLDFLGANCGVSRPEDLFLNDDIFRQLIPLLCFGDIVTKKGLYDLLALFFSDFEMHAHCISTNFQLYRMVKTVDFTGDGNAVGEFTVGSVTDLGIGFEVEIEDDTPGSRITATITDIQGAGPFTIEVEGGTIDLSAYLVAQNAQVRTGETLTVETEKGTESLRWTLAAFADNDQSTAQELADFYNATMTLSTAQPFTDPSTGNIHFAILTTGFGASGFVHVVSGTANNVLNFDTASICKNAGVIVVEPGDEDGVEVEGPDDIPSAVERDLRGSWHLRADHLIVDGRPAVSAANPFYPGAFLASPATNRYIRIIKTTLAENINAGDFKNTVTLADASSFPNAPGRVIFDFGNTNEEGPVNYQGRSGNTILIFNPGVAFTQNHIIGDEVHLSVAPTGTGPADYGAGAFGYKPRDTGGDYMAFVTDPLSAAVVLSELLLEVTAGGIPISFLSGDPLVYRWDEL